MHEPDAFDVDIWPLLRETTDFVPPQLSSGSVGRFQVFEVLITWIISKKMPDFHWTVTRVQGDGGVDFVGRRNLMSLGQNQSLLPEFVVIGQCKVRNQHRSQKVRRSDAHSQLERDFRHSLDTLYGGSAGRLFPKLLIGCLVDKISVDERAKSVDSLSRANEAPVALLDIDDISRLIADHMELLASMVHSSRAYSDEEARAILTYFEQASSANLSDRITCQVTRSSTDILTGETIDLFITLHGKGGPLPDFEMVHRDLPIPEVEILQGVEPGHSGEGLFSDDLSSASMHLKFRSFSVGAHCLGALELRHGNDTVSFDLGTVNVEYTFQHKYFWWPELKNSANNLIYHIRQRTREKRAVLCGLIGPGGSGKTRFVEEVALSRNMRSWRYARLSQNRASARPMALILDLTCYATLGETQYLPAHDDAISRVLAVFRTGPAATATQSFKSLTDSGDRLFDGEGLAIALAALFRERSLSKNLLLHIADMHRAPSDTLNLVKQIIGLINRDLSTTEGKVAVLIEGRDFSERSPVNRRFERQLKSSANLVVDLPTLGNSAAKFIDHVFLTAQNPKHTISPEDVTSFSRLREMVVARAGGNPMFIIETLKLLVELSLLRSDPRTGLLYLAQRISDDLVIPQSVEDCLRRRIDLLNESDPQLSATFSACSILDDGIDQDLFDQICAHFEAGALRDRLFSMGALVEQKIPGQSRRVTFAHEYYYQVARSYSAMHHKDVALLEILLTDMQAKPVSAQRLFDEARLAGLNAQLRLPAPEQLFRKALALAKASDQGPLEYKIASQLVDHWEKNGDKIATAVNNTEIALRFSELLLRYADRTSAMTWLKDMTHSVTSNIRLLEGGAQCQNVDPVFLKAKILLQLGNSSLNQLVGEFAIAQIRAAVAEIDAFQSEIERPGGDVVAEMWRDMKILAYDRLGCAYRLEGQIENATKAAQVALNDAREKPEGLTAMHAVFDYGRLVALHNPPAALEYYHEATVILKTCAADVLRHENLIKVSRYSALLQPARAENDARPVAEQLEKMADDIALAGYGLETGATLLNQSAASAFWDPRQALAFAEDAAEWNMDRNYLEMLWKCHHNACVSAMILSDRPKSEFHAQRCYEIIIDRDLQRREEPRRLERMRRCEPTLRLLAQGGGGIDPALSDLVAGLGRRITGWGSKSYRDLVTDFEDERPQVECLSNGTDIFYVF